MAAFICLWCWASASLVEAQPELPPPPVAEHPAMTPDQERLWISLQERLDASEARTRELEQRLDALSNDYAPPPPLPQELFEEEESPPVVPAPRGAAEPDPGVKSLVGPPRSYRPMETSLKSDKDKEKKWYDKISLRGYGQFRYNRLAESDGTYVSTQGDRSIGDNQSFLLRRARLIFSGDISDHLYIYIQPDFASGVTGPNPLHFAQLRDFYADIAIDEAKEFRFRVGQSKVPFGFEILQSSQNRLALDRNDAMNSAAVNERDLGVFFYYAPEEIRERFKYLVQSGLKGSGDYGILGLGVYNGQTANRAELNDQVHMIFRMAYPFELANGQYFEPFFGGYHGKYDITRSAGIGGGDTFLDQRLGGGFVFYPQPIGVQMEFNVGRGPELNDSLTAVEDDFLHGGYVQLFYRVVTDNYGVVIPFTRFQYYRGGRKHDVNAPKQVVDEAEIGFEWEFLRELELTAMYTWGNRTTATLPYPVADGSLMRLQLQWNY